MFVAGWRAGAFRYLIFFGYIAQPSGVIHARAGLCAPNEHNLG